MGRNGGGLGTLNPVALARLMLPTLLLHEDGPEADIPALNKERVSVT